MKIAAKIKSIFKIEQLQTHKHMIYNLTAEFLNIDKFLEDEVTYVELRLHILQVISRSQTNSLACLSVHSHDLHC